MVCLDEDEVVLRCVREQAVQVGFAERHVAAKRLDGRMFFLMWARAPRLDARLEGVTNFVVGDGLPQFLEGLEVEGWVGERRWVNADRDLAVSARYESGGYIGLRWTLAPWRGVYGGWSAEVTTWLEAGEARDVFVAELRHFLAAEGCPVDHCDSDELLD